MLNREYLLAKGLDKVTWRTVKFEKRPLSVLGPPMFSYHVEGKEPAKETKKVSRRTWCPESQGKNVLQRSGEELTVTFKH